MKTEEGLQRRVLKLADTNDVFIVVEGGLVEGEQVVLNPVAFVAEAQSADPWTSRARPSFLYVMYALILFSVPMGVIAAFDPIAARAIGEGMTRYLSALPEALYALFGTGYLGYTAARQWGKVKGVDQ
ncbi:MAG TPA: hypothetical protein DIW45_11325 [Erythrobacter sp.]|nr:hypothetical protein [Erythrobacter sp.]